MHMVQVLWSQALLVLAGVCEIVGGYLIWQWWRQGAHGIVGIVGALVLMMSGVIPTDQTSAL